MKEETLVWVLSIGLSMISFLIVVMIGLIKHIWRERKKMLNVQMTALEEGNKTLAAEVATMKEENATLKSETSNLTNAIGELRKWLSRVNKEHTEVLKDVATLKARSND